MEYKLYQKIKSIRAFNRYYTNILGLVNKNILDYNFSLAEARVLLEISKIENCTSKKLSDLLNMDAGYMVYFIFAIPAIVDVFMKGNVCYDK